MSARWQVARLVFYEDLNLNVNSIYRFLKISNSMRESMKMNVRSLAVDANHADEDAAGLRIIESSMPGSNIQSPFNQSCHTDTDWSDDVKLAALTHLVPHLSQMPRITYFKIVLPMESLTAPPGQVPYFDRVSELLSVLPTSLTSLTIDSGTQLRPPRLETGRELAHMCLLLRDRSFMPSLRYLRLRLYNIYPSMFQSLSTGPDPKLQTLVINPVNERPSSIFYSMDAIGYPRPIICSTPILSAPLIEAARAYITHTPRLKYFRFITDKSSNNQFRSYDVFSDRWATHADEGSWEDIENIKDD